MTYIYYGSSIRSRGMVKLAAPEKFRNSLIFKKNVFNIVAMYDEGIKLSFSDQIVTAADILPVKIDGAENRSQSMTKRRMTIKIILL